MWRGPLGAERAHPPAPLTCCRAVGVAFWASLMLNYRRFMVGVNHAANTLTPRQRAAVKQGGLPFQLAEFLESKTENKVGLMTV